MEKADKYSLFLLLILVGYLSSSFILNAFVKNSELADLFAILTFMITLTCVFSFVGYLIIKSKKYTRNQRIFLFLFLIFIWFIDFILLIIAAVSGLWIYYPILGIYNSISLATFVMFLVIIGSKSSKI